MLPQRYVDIDELSDKELWQRYRVCKSHLEALQRRAKRKPLKPAQKTVIHFLEVLEIPALEAEIEFRSNPLFERIG